MPYPTLLVAWLLPMAIAVGIQPCKIHIIQSQEASQTDVNRSCPMARYEVSKIKYVARRTVANANDNGDLLRTTVPK